MKYNIFILPILFMVLSSCSSDEDKELIVPVANEEYFASDLANSAEELQMRKEFYKKTGTYLVFNDTLAQKKSYSDLQQKYVDTYETIDLNYSISSSTKNIFRFVKFTSIKQKKSATDFIQNELFLNIPSKIRPFSVLLLDSLIEREHDIISNTYKDPASKIIYTGLQSTAIAIHGIENMNDQERYAYKRSILKEIISRQITNMGDEDLKSFYDYSNKYYSISIWYMYSKCNGDPKSIGFLASYPLSLYDLFYRPYNQKSFDLSAYIDEIFSLTSEEFDSKYAKYLICIQKKQALINILEKSGIKIY